VDTITVLKNDLIETLKANRDAHRDMFLRAQTAYRAKMIEELDRALDEAKNGGTIRRSFALPVPEDHTDDFNTAIQMLEWHQGKTADLSQHEFMNYVENNWGWRQSFAANTASYLAGS
jgi:hypothetical protein